MDRTIQYKVAYVDDELVGSELIGQLVREQGFDYEFIHASPATTVEGVKSAISDLHRRGTLVAVISDLKMWGRDSAGLDVLSHAFSLSRSLELCALTAYKEIIIGNQYRSGLLIPAFRVIEKGNTDALSPWLLGLQRTLEGRSTIIAGDPRVRKIYEQLVPIYARSSLPLLLLGETGTGKERLAEKIHAMSGLRGKMYSVNSGGLEPTLAFGELFGHAAGAYTDARSHELGIVLRASGYKSGSTKGPAQAFDTWLKSANTDLCEVDGLLYSQEAERRAGTLFLDEVAMLPPKVMVGLLRLLSSKDVRPLGYHGPGIRSFCRIVAATNQTDVLVSSLGNEEDAWRFRRDLCYRLAGAVLRLPPLRERDARDIVDFVNDVYWNQIGGGRLEVTTDAAGFIVDLFQKRTDDLARQYQRGNFRALFNLMHRARLIAQSAQSGRIDGDHVGAAVEHGELVADASGPERDQNQYIREQFASILRQEHATASDLLSYHEIKRLVEKSPDAVGFAFLKCACMARAAQHPIRRYYSLSEIETALSSGLRSRGALLGKTITAQLLMAVASERFGIAVLGGDTIPTPIQIVELVRRHVNEGG